MTIETLKTAYEQMLAEYSNRIQEMIDQDIPVDNDTLNQKIWIENVLMDIERHM